MTLVKQVDPTVIELFAGVGGFRLGLEGHPEYASTPGSGWKVVWANQWEPPGRKTRQFAFDCYVRHFDPDNQHPEQHVNEDISTVDAMNIPDADLLVGGFPCQDYSVAKPLSQAKGIEGKKGVLWWQIYRILAAKRPRFVLLENVDRLLKSPVSKRGRDFAIILACFASLGYTVEWRAVNAAEYGFPQKRRRVFIFAQRPSGARPKDPLGSLHTGVLGRALPTGNTCLERPRDFKLPCMPERLPNAGDKDRDFRVQTWASQIGKSKRLNRDESLFANAGLMHKGHVWTARVKVDDCMKERVAPSSVKRTLGAVIEETETVPEDYLIPPTQVPSWLEHKGAKSLARTHKGSNTEYRYAEGSMCFPDNVKDAARTVLTSEGGKSATRSKHAVPLLPTTKVERLDGTVASPTDLKGFSYRRLIPDELDEISGFPRGWTNTGMKPNQRAFCIGNALVVGIVQLIGEEIRALASQ